MSQECVMLLLMYFVLLDSEPHTLETTIDNIIREAPLPLKISLLMKHKNSITFKSLSMMRKVDIETLRKPAKDIDMTYKIKRRDGDDDGNTESNEKDEIDESTPYDDHDIVMTTIGMLHKLSRNCYKKAKRAEIIRQKYANNTAFEIGILVGQAESLFSWLNKFRATMRYFKPVWIPIEHLNAYEHIETYSLQIKQMVDVIEMANRKKSG